jgi:6-phosphofructokinase 1
VAKSAALRGWETLGVHGGFDGLLEPRAVEVLDWRRLEPLVGRGGTILGTRNRGRFSAKTGHGETRQLPRELLDETKRAAQELELHALVAVGGDGSLTIAHQLHRHGLNVVGVPKTIDNDLCGTVMTFGFDSAVACATDAIDRLQTTAESHQRVMVLEVMGRYAGWIAMYSGIAGGANVILIPEIPFRWESVCAKLNAMRDEGSHSAIVVAAEGALPQGESHQDKPAQVADREARLGGIGVRVADELAERTGRETRAMVLGHLQRGGRPTHMDRALCTMYGAKAVDLIAEGEFGHMVSFTGAQMTSVRISEAIGTLRTVPRGGNFESTARAMGICLGD